MKILFYSQNYYPEPFRPQLIAEELVKMGHDVTVITGLPNTASGKIQKEYRYFKKRNEIVNGVKVKRMPIVAKKNRSIFLALNYLSYFILASLKTLFLSWKYDVVFAYQLTPVTQALPAILYKKLHHKKLITYCLDLWPESIVSSGYIKKNSSIYNLTDKMSKWIYKNSDKILLSSKSFQDYFVNVLNIDVDKLTYWPQFAEDIFNNNSKQFPTELNEKNINIVFTGNIGKLQNLENVLKAMSQIKHRNDIKLFILGDGSEQEALIKFKNEHNLENVIFLGRKPIEYMPSYYNQATFLLVSLIDDGIISKTLPGKVQAYMNFGKPIIGLASGETKIVIEEAKCGMCFASNDIDGFKTFLDEYTSSKYKLSEFSANAKKYYDQNFNKNDLMIKLLKLFESEELN